MNLVRREPAAIAAGVMAVFESAIALAVGFGWVDWSAEQTALVAGFGGTVLALIGGMFVRQRVTPL